MECPFFDWEVYQGFCQLFNIEMNKLTFQTITFLLKIILSHYFSCGFCETNQVVIIFILYLMVNENVTCSFSWGDGEVTTVISSIDLVLMTSS